MKSDILLPGVLYSDEGVLVATRSWTGIGYVNNGTTSVPPGEWWNLVCAVRGNLFRTRVLNGFGDEAPVHEARAQAGYAPTEVIRLVFGDQGHPDLVSFPTRKAGGMAMSFFFAIIIFSQGLPPFFSSPRPRRPTKMKKTASQQGAGKGISP